MPSSKRAQPDVSIAAPLNEAKRPAVASLGSPLAPPSNKPEEDHLRTATLRGDEASEHSTFESAVAAAPLIGYESAHESDQQQQTATEQHLQQHEEQQQPRPQQEPPMGPPAIGPCQQKANEKGAHARYALE